MGDVPASAKNSSRTPLQKKLTAKELASSLSHPAMRAHVILRNWHGCYAPRVFQLCRLVRFQLTLPLVWTMFQVPLEQRFLGLRAARRLSLQSHERNIREEYRPWNQLLKLS
jgi:hypothetical protein